MGMFGNKAGMKQPFMADQRVPQPAMPQMQAQAKPGWADILMSVGALMADVGGGQGPQYSMQIAKQRRDALMQQQKQAAMQNVYGLFGGSAQGAGVGGGPNLRDPRVAQALLAAEGMGVDVGTALELMKAQRPQVQIGPDGTPYDQTDPASLQRRFRNPTAVANTVVDLNNPENEGMVVPEAPVKGAMPVYDNRGRVVDWTMPQGALGAIQASTGAETAGRTGGTLYKVPRSDGSEAFMTGNQFLGGGGPSAGAPRMGGPQLGITQSPADRVKAEAAAKAQADAKANLPVAIQTAQETLALIDKIKKHPSLDARTGLSGSLPAIPGTPGKDFDVMIEQARGGVFLQAYESLKGGGQITEVEGRKAEQAKARMDRAQSREAFVAALDEFAGIIKAGAERAKRAAGRPDITPEQARAALAERRARAGQ